MTIRIVSDEQAEQIRKEQDQRDLQLQAILNAFKLDPADAQRVKTTVPFTNRAYIKYQAEKRKEKELAQIRLNSQVNRSFDNDLEL